MREPPPGVDLGDILDVVRAAWLPSAETAEHLPVGFGAHHWAVAAGGERRLFVTLDHFGERHGATSLEDTYAAAAQLAADGLAFVVACVPAASGYYTVPFGDGALTATGWLDGVQPKDPAPARELVARLHSVAAPSRTPRWRPLVAPTLAADLAELVREPWATGPLGEEARDAVADRLDAIGGWTADYHRLAEEGRRRPWVATHGEPHERNLLVTGSEVRLVDWESLKLAPAERDLRVLGGDGGAASMLELFDLEWRLDEIAQYAAWFAAPHSGTASDRVALAGLRHELHRP